jgi:4'-phosphopantetheinyl transferase
MDWLLPPSTLPVLRANTVHLWRAHLDSYAGPAVLSADEKARAASFKFPLHQQRFIAARSVLRTILARYIYPMDVKALGIPEKIVFAYSKYGKPYLAENTASLFFNLSHTKEWALYAISLEEKIGVDIESIQTEKEVENIASRFFSPYENKQLNQLSADKKIAAFFQLWACKEAFIKAVGEGLSFPLKDFDIALQENTAHLRSIRGDKRAGESWSVLPLYAQENYAAALAVKTQVECLHAWQFCAANP